MTPEQIYTSVYTTLLRGALPTNVVQRNIVLSARPAIAAFRAGNAAPLRMFMLQGSKGMFGADRAQFLAVLAAASEASAMRTMGVPVAARSGAASRAIGNYYETPET